MTKVAVEESVLRWAVARAEPTLDELERRFPRLPDWICGDERPTLAQLERFAKATYTPLGDFFLSKPPEERLPVPHFRTMDSLNPPRPSANLVELLYTMERRKDWMREYLIEQGQDPLPFVASASLGESAGAVAGRMRKTLGFSEDWPQRSRSWQAALKELRDTMERQGVLVSTSSIVGNNTRRKLNVEEFRGFVLIDDYAPSVFVNGVDDPAAQMFTLAHELAHVFYGSGAAFDLHELRSASDATECACDQAAGAFLLPEDRLRASWTDAACEEEGTEEVARRLKVSALVVARRALDLELVRPSEYRRLFASRMQAYRKNKEGKKGGGDFYKVQRSRLGAAFSLGVIRQVRNGRLSYLEAYRLTSLHGNKFERYAASVLGN